MFSIIFIASLISLISIIILRPIAVKLGFVDCPTKRKTHTGNIPPIGGPCIFLGTVISYFFVVDFYNFYTILLLSSSLVLILGVYDDLKNLKASIKMIFQALVTLIIIYITDLKVENLGYLFGFLQSIELGILSIPFTVIAVVGLTNSFNMLDGLDGLAISLIIVAIIGHLVFHQHPGFTNFEILLLIILGASLPFFVFNIVNYTNLKIFLGDGGSLFLGFVLSWSLIYNTQVENNFKASFALWCVAIPLYDFLAVVITRTIQKSSLIIANKDHIHHVLEKEGFNKLIILLIIVMGALFLLLVGKLIEDNFPFLSFPIFIILFLFYLTIKIYMMNKKKY